MGVLMITLALDLAGRTGWAIQFEDGSVRCGIWTLTRGNLGGARSTIPMLRLWKRLQKLAESYEIGKIVLEEAFAQGAARFRLDSLQYTAILFACLGGLNWMRVSPGAWKRRVVGSGKARRNEYLSFAKRKWPELRFWTDDQAAAMCLLEFEKSV